MKDLKSLTELRKLLNGMDVPTQRKVLHRANLLWLRRNLAMRNDKHKDFDRTMEIIKHNLKIHIT